MKLEDVTLTVSKYGVTVAISSYFSVVSRCRFRLGSRPHGCLVAPERVVFGAGTGERRTFLIRSIAKVIRSDRQRRVLSDSPVDQVSQAFQCASPFTHGTSVRQRQRSLRSKMVRLWSVISVIQPPPVPPVPITPYPHRSHGNPMERAKQVRNHPQGRWWKVLRGLSIPFTHCSGFSIDAGIVALRFSKERTSSTMKPA
jgi:hypothetical protein